MVHYFAYGSNLHPLRLQARVPSAKLLGAVEVNKFKLEFNKQSHDGSSKCNLIKSGSGNGPVYGAIYEMRPEHKDSLDRHEGKGNGYMDGRINLQLDGKEVSCFTYFAQDSHIVDNLRPYHWYKKLVELGARHCQFPDSYVNQIKAFESMQDPDRLRTRDMEILIQKINMHGSLTV